MTSAVYTDPSSYEERIAAHCKDDIQVHPLLNDAIQHELINMRRYLHTIAELSFEEYNTSQYIQQCLTNYGCDHVVDKVAKTGVVAWIYGQKQGEQQHHEQSSASSTNCVALRADMDALPIVEQDNDRTRTFKSSTDAMHGK